MFFGQRNFKFYSDYTQKDVLKMHILFGKDTFREAFAHRKSVAPHNEGRLFGFAKGNDGKEGNQPAVFFCHDSHRRFPWAPIFVPNNSIHSHSFPQQICSPRASHRRHPYVQNYYFLFIIIFEWEMWPKFQMDSIFIPHFMNKLEKKWPKEF
jgi:hypothetical protein